MVGDCDLLVIGGGPAGCAAAITAARLGLEVVLVDKAEFPRDKCCGDGLTTSALRRLESLGLRTEDVKSWQWVDDVHVRSVGGRTAHYPLPRAGQGHFAAVATRMDLDAALLDVARDQVAKVHTGHAVIGVREDAAGVVAEVEGVGSIRAAHVVAADGMWSPTRKLLTAGDADDRYLGDWHAYRQYFRDTLVTDLWVWFEPDILPGYVWAFPLPGGGANVGFGVERRAGGPPTKHMKTLWPELLARPHVTRVLGPHAQPVDAPKAWPIPASIGDAQLAVGRVLFAGDAARACDVLTGEGIGQALQTGTAAAHAIAGASGVATSAADGAPTRTTAAAAVTYEAAVRAELGPDHRMASLLQRALRRAWVCNAAVRLSDGNDWTRRNFGRWLFEDYERGIALTPRRWRRGAMSGYGAYRGRDIDGDDGEGGVRRPI